MLAGVPPFQGENELEIVKKVKAGIYDLNIPELENVSIEAKELISQMMMYNPSQRPSADACLNHGWIKLYD